MFNKANTPEGINNLTSEELRAKLSKIKCFMLDMDGTFYLGDRLLEGSLDFLEKLSAILAFRNKIRLSHYVFQGTFNLNLFTVCIILVSDNA